MKGNVSHITIIFLSGLNQTVSHRFPLFSLTLLCYCLVLLVNVSLIVTIIFDRTLHEPMYILLCFFCMNGIYGTAGFYPKFLWDLLSPVHVISYAGCLVQALVLNSFACSEFSILAVMAYDRFLAICRPLEYHSLMSKQRLVKIVCSFWFMALCMNGANVFLTSRLKLCNQFINRLFCVNWSIVKLACFPSETLINSIMAYIITIVYFCHGWFIFMSYFYLIKTCVNSIENRSKFMQTCVPHLTSLFLLAVTILFNIMTMRFGSEDLPVTIQNFAAVEFLLIPPFMNPLIYGFKLTKIRNRILGFVIFKVKWLLSKMLNRGSIIINY